MSSLGTYGVRLMMFAMLFGIVGVFLSMSKTMSPQQMGLVSIFFFSVSGSLILSSTVFGAVGLGKGEHPRKAAVTSVLSAPIVTAVVAFAFVVETIIPR